MKFNKETILLGDIINYSLKGLTGALGRGEGLTKFLRSISVHLEKNNKLNDLTNAIVSTKLLKNGDVIVVPSKIVALLEKRFVYGLTVENYNKCITDFDFAQKNLKMADKSPFTKKDQIGLDKIDPKKKLGIRYPKDPNLSAYKIAKSIQNKSGVKADVVVSDSDSGGQKGLILIGCPTIIATPIGATEGLRFFYCMRAAVAAEITWNNVKDTPVVLIQPPENYAVRLRKDVGKLRYKGFLDASKEEDVISLLREK